MHARQILAKKLVNVLITLLAIWTINFVLFHMLPGDPTYTLLPPRAPEEARDAMRVAFGLDKPLLDQYFIALKSLLSYPPDFGYSWFYKEPVWDVVSESLIYTVLLLGPGTFIAVIIGVRLGIVAGSRNRQPVDVAIVGTSLAFYSMPPFWLGMVLLMTLAGGLGLFPMRGFEDVTKIDETLGEAVLDRIWHMFLPVLTVVLLTLSEFVLMMRNSLVDVLTEDFIVTARAKGVSPKDIVHRHAVPNAMLPTVATTAMYIGWIVTGAIMIEVVFSWPGVGNLTYLALKMRDFPVLQCIFLVVAVAMLFANLVADVVYTYIDPRVRI
ncbi:MAG TPA: ABC transporter permease [Thermoplasmata archaeon]|jgi:peptide/nickel transport system permease protein